MVASDEDISQIMMYDSHMVPESGVRPLCEILAEAA